MDCSPPCCSGSRDQAIQSIGSVDRRNGVSSDSISNVNDKHPSLALTELVSEDEKEINAGNGSSWNGLGFCLLYMLNIILRGLIIILLYLTFSK